MREEQSRLDTPLRGNTRRRRDELEGTCSLRRRIQTMNKILYWAPKDANGGRRWSEKFADHIKETAVRWKT